MSVGANVLYIAFLARNIVSRKHFKYPLHKEYLILNRDDAKKNANLEGGSYRKLSYFCPLTIFFLAFSLPLYFFPFIQV